MARQGKVLGIVCATVLFCHYMLNVVREFAMCLSKKTVFTTIPRPLPHELPRGKIHRY
jgi:hypothetical protein